MICSCELQNMKLALVTINYNGSQDTVELLRSLESQTDQDFRCIVVDNASYTDDYTELVAFGERPWLTYVRSEQNGGFAAGANIGMKQAFDQGAGAVLLINNDTTVQPDFIASLKQHMPSEGLAAVPLNEHGATVYAGKIKWLRHTLSHITSPITGDDPSLYIVGGGLFIHRSAFSNIGALDERYFLYFEDTDYSVRAHNAHVSFTYLTLPIIAHKVSRSTSTLGSPMLLRYHYRNMFLFNQLHAPWYIKAILPLWALMGILKQMLKLILRPSERPQSKAIFAGILDFVTGAYGKIL